MNFFDRIMQGGEPLQALQALCPRCTHLAVQGEIKLYCASGHPRLPHPTPQPCQGDWYALVASAEFFFRGAQNEALPEQLRELKRYYDEKGRGQDFYIVSQPHWLDAKFPNEAKKVRRPAAALISTDKAWIT